ncbi:MAG: bacteriohemerythrin [Bacteroidales bacterium]|nr:bacteriohemerythrin [Bacteroidales bacterium]
MYFNWEREYETGVEKIDSQHKKLVEMINQLYKDLVINNNINSLNEVIMDLKIYTIFHFSTEEKLFKKYNYQGEDYISHIKKHEQFKKKIADCLGDTTSSKKELAYNISEYLKNWLIHHILDTDMKFASFLKQNNFTEITTNDNS